MSVVCLDCDGEVSGLLFAVGWRDVYAADPDDVWEHGEYVGTCPECAALDDKETTT